MAVFLKILMIIGIVLLALLGIILLAVFLVLFVPIRYKATGAFKDNKPSFCAGVSWLLHIVSVKYLLGADEPLSIRILGIRLKKKEEKAPSFDSNYSQPVSEETLIEEESESAPKPVVESVPESADESTADTIPESVPDFTPEIHETPKADKRAESVKTKKEKVKKNKDKNKDFENQSFYDKIKRYIEIIESKRFKTAFEYSKKKIVKLLKHILPRRIRINGEVGFDDPSVTGQILVITSMMIPLLGNKVNIRGNFEEPVIDIEGMLKGRITVFRALWTLAVLYFNKNIRKIIKMFREV